VGILDKGFDYPEASCLIMARPTKSLMLYIQQAGRVLRTHESKTDAIILDHAGNTEQHGFVTDDLPQELDDGTKKLQEKSHIKKKEEPVICPSCAYVKPPKVHVCPLCSFAPKKKDTGVVTESGNLIEIQKITSVEKQQLYSELLHIEIFKPYKKGFAAQMYRGKYGVWPKGLKEYPIEPSAETQNYVTHRLIAYSRRRA
jgi:superfamily II DNA or RNA helicase